MREIKNIIWDWNGTLLDDLDITVEVVNSLLHRRGMAAIEKEYHLANMIFPIREYYTLLGFDLEREDWGEIGKEFIAAYKGLLPQARLKDGALLLLERGKKSSRLQAVLSAYPHEELLKAIEAFSLASFFFHLQGQSGNVGGSKLEQGKALMKELGWNADQTVYVGDTEHDFEVAQELGVRSILVACGHCAEDRLRATGAEVVPTFSALEELLFEPLHASSKGL